MAGGRQFKVGDAIIYRVSKSSRHPGPRAKRVSPAPNGDTYSYFVEKFWTVSAIGPDGTLIAKTRRGKTRELEPEDPNLRVASVLERALFRDRFPIVESQ